MFGIIQISITLVQKNLYGQVNYSLINNIQTLPILITIYTKIQYLISSKVHLDLQHIKSQRTIWVVPCSCGDNITGVMPLMVKSGHVLLVVLKECGIQLNQHQQAQYNTIKWNLLCVNFTNKVFTPVQWIQTGHVLVILKNDF